jgi:MGT family glycosyltransferase
MGTLYLQDPAFFQICFEAFKEKPYNVIMSIGNSKVEELGEIPKNFIVRNHVPQLAVLKITKVYISHAGMGGISEAIFFSVPMILLPKTIEQQINARRMVELGASIDLKSPEATPEDLLYYTEILMGPDRTGYVENIEKVATSFKESGGVAPAVDEVEKKLWEAMNRV